MLGRFLNYALVPLYLSKFTPAEYGVVSVMFTYASFLAIFFALGLETAFLTFPNKHSNLPKFSLRPHTPSYSLGLPLY